MKNNYILSICFALFVLLLECQYAVSQDEMMHTQSVMKQEYLNPAYNSFKDFTSISLFSRQQWSNTVVGSPETYAASFYTPMRLSGLGIGLITISEKIGLRNKVSASGSLTTNVRLASTSYLAFGFGLGFESTTYDRERMILQYPGLDIGDFDLNYTKTSITLGFFYYATHVFCGLSSNTLIDRQRISGDWFLPGFDFSLGSMHQLNKNVMFRPELAIKYYHVRDVVYDDGIRNISFFDPIYELSANFLLDNRLWLGTSRRFNQAHTFSVDVIIHEKLKLGYTYELGIGSGLNQFNSQGIRLSWNFTSSDRARRNFQLPSGSVHRSSTNYLYK